MKTKQPIAKIFTARPDEEKLSCCTHVDQSECPAEARQQPQKSSVGTTDERPAYYHREIF